jgi:hypothetical protein
MSGAVNRLVSPLLGPLLGGGPVDMTDLYNTKLSPAEEAAYQQWAKANHRERDTFDYDMRGAWKAMAKQAGNGHFPDTFKKPNHPTFSDESMYAGPGLPGGHWGDGVFAPAQTNLRNYGLLPLLGYMQRTEPDYQLQTPPNLLAGMGR